MPARIAPFSGLAITVLLVLLGHGGRADETKPDAAKSPPSAKEVLKAFREEFVAITPGKGQFPKSFEMGSAQGTKSEQPPHQVTFDYDFQIAKYEVTQQLYEAVMGKNPSVWGGPRNSVEMVSFRDAEAFCAQTTSQLREAGLITPAEIVRLPTEAEWEYCCRAGTTTAYSFGQQAKDPGDAGLTAGVLNLYGWHTGNAAGNDPPVGALKANPWGLYDVHGYLWEYVSDGWHPNYQDAPTDGGSWESDSRTLPRVIRGGSWRDPYSLLQSTTRWPLPDHVKSDAIGFRCVLAKKGEG